MFAKRISPAEYEELMRRRTVPELAAILKRHPYFGDSLATLSTIDPHRGQIEELLSMDIFKKYQALEKYNYSGDAFTGYYLWECEAREVLKALHLLSIGLPGAYLNQIPAYLVGHTRIDLFRLGQARNFGMVVEAAHGAPYYKALRARWLADPLLRDFPMVEAAMLRRYYADLFERIGKTLRGRERRTVSALFSQEAEVYNLELIMRVKTYFPHVYRHEQLRGLLLPYRYRLGGATLNALVEAQSPEAVMQIFRQSPAIHYTGPATPDDLAGAGSQRIYTFARRVLHLTASPQAALAAFVNLAKLERDNVVNVVEGVRYGLPPETIRTMLRF